MPVRQNRFPGAQAGEEFASSHSKLQVLRTLASYCAHGEVGNRFWYTRGNVMGEFLDKLWEVA